MIQRMADTPAAETYTIEPIDAPAAKKWGSTAIAWVTALFTLGGGTTPIVGSGVRILDREGRVLAEHVDEASSMAATFESAQQDLTAMSANAFASRWITGSQS
jgi:hypothetical protein